MSFRIKILEIDEFSELGITYIKGQLLDGNVVMPARGKVVRDGVKIEINITDCNLLPITVNPKLDLFLFMIEEPVDLIEGLEGAILEG